MFAKTVIDSDLFLDMPMSARLLYYDLGMRADDDGFINNPKKIAKITGASDDDFRVLFSKNFIIPFRSGVVVIKHWKVNNYIQKDRYHETQYLDEKSQLCLSDNNTYEMSEKSMDTECIQDVSNLDTQSRLGKVRLYSTTTARARACEDDDEKKSDVAQSLVNSDLAAVNRYWDENVSPITPAIAREFSAMLQKGFKAEIITAAIKEGVESVLRPNFKYVKTILDRWAAQGIDTLAKVKEDGERRQKPSTGRLKKPDISTPDNYNPPQDDGPLPF